MSERAIKKIATFDLHEYGSKGISLTSRDDRHGVFNVFTTLSSVEAFAQMLRDVAEVYGPPCNRYSEEIVRVINLPGPKFNGKLSIEKRQEIVELIRELKVILDESSEK